MGEATHDKAPLPTARGGFLGVWWWGDLSDSPLCPFRRALCCVRAAVPCWPSAPCWPSWLSCCPAEPASAESAPWLATCRQQQASDGALLFGVGTWGVLWWHRGAQQHGELANPNRGWEKSKWCFSLVIAIEHHLQPEPGLQVPLAASSSGGCAGQGLCLPVTFCAFLLAGCCCTSWGPADAPVKCPVPSWWLRLWRDLPL